MTTFLKTLLKKAITYDSPVKSFLDLYVTCEPDRVDVSIPVSIFRHIFNHYYPNKTSSHKLNPELKKYLPGCVKTIRGSSTYRSYSNVWIKRKYLRPVVETILNNRHHTKPESDEVFYNFKTRDDKKLVCDYFKIINKDEIRHGDVSLTKYESNNL